MSLAETTNNMGLLSRIGAELTRPFKAVGTALDSDAMTSGGYAYDPKSVQVGGPRGAETYTVKRKDLSTGMEEVVAAPQEIIEKVKGPGFTATTPAVEAKQGRAQGLEERSLKFGEENYRSKQELEGRRVGVEERNAGTNEVLAGAQQTSANAGMVSAGTGQTQAVTGRLGTLGNIRAGDQAYDINKQQLSQGEVDRLLAAQGQIFNQTRQTDMDRWSKGMNAVSAAHGIQQTRWNNISGSLDSLANAFFNIRKGG